MKHILIVLAENKPGVLNRVTSLCRQRQYNVESLTAGYTEQKNISHMTIVIETKEPNIEQAKKQMYKLIDVIKVYELPYEKGYTRELALIKVKSNRENRAHLLRLAETFETKTIDMTPGSIIMEISAESERINSLIKVLEEYGIEEIKRTGIIAIQKLK